VEVVALLIFVGALWVLSAIGFFAWNLLAKNHEHADRLALLPLEDNWTDTKRAVIAEGKSKSS
jgi:hypothetical protein